MSSGGQTGSNGQTLSYVVAPGDSITMSFSASGSQPGSDPITRYEWSSNGTVIGTAPSFTFPFAAATHNISLKVMSSAGDSDVATATIIVSTSNFTPPNSHFSMSAQGQTKTDGQTLSLSVPVNGNVTVNFSSTSSQGSASITNYVWKSNGTQICSNSSTCSFNFGTASNTITLTVTDSNGQSSTATGTVALTFH